MSLFYHCNDQMEIEKLAKKIFVHGIETVEMNECSRIEIPNISCGMILCSKLHI